MQASVSVGIIDYGMGNIGSVKNLCDHVGVKNMIAAKPDDLESCTHIILPGVGSFAKGMQNLLDRGFADRIVSYSQGDTKYILGICLGMQLMATEGYEGGKTAGMNIIPGKVDKFSSTVGRIPHVGWNEVISHTENKYFDQSLNGDYYFVHSYHFEPVADSDVAARTDYKLPFVSAIARGQVFGVQFHPEKSHQLGVRLMHNYFNQTC